MGRNINTLKVGKFVQRSRKFFEESQGIIHSLALDNNGKLYAATDNGLIAYENDKFSSVSFENEGKKVNTVYCDRDNKIWFAVQNNLYTIENESVKLFAAIDEDIIAISQDSGKTLWFISEENLYKVENGKVLNTRSIDGKGQCMATYTDGKVFVGSNLGILALVGKRPHWSSLIPYTTNILSNDVRAICVDDWGQIIYGTDKGAGMHDNKSYWFDCRHSSAFTKEKVNCIATDKVGGRYYGTDIGIVYQRDGSYSHWSSRRWLPCDKVNAIAVSDDGTSLWVATDCGISNIISSEMTLLEKAEHFQKTVEKYNVRKDGFVTIRELYESEDLDNGYVEISDNDGLWTGNYVAALSLKYAVTKDEETLKCARRSMNAMLKLTQITNIPGFTARAIRYEGEEGYGDGDKEWPLAHDGSCEWKCETSSDEMTGHFFGLSLYYDLCADEDEKKTICNAICGIMDHIIKNDYRLVDHDGLPTTWAMWSPKCLNNDNKWAFEKGTNSMEIMTFLLTAYHMSGDEKYYNEYKDLVQNHHYAMNIAHHKIEEAHVCHIDDNLCFLAVYTLLRYEQNPDIRSLIYMGLEHHWSYERIERCPLWNLMYGALTGKTCDIDTAIQSLIELPLDLTHYTINNSRRKDLVWDTEQEAWAEEPQLLRPLPHDEKPITKYDANPFRPDAENEGKRVEDGTMFLLPYWLGRYEGLIEEQD